jgi:hypothetical protein
MSTTAMESATGARLLANHIGGEWVASSSILTQSDRDLEATRREIGTPAACSGRAAATKKAPQCRALVWIAGAGFEPATFGL